MDVLKKIRIAFIALNCLSLIIYVVLIYYFPWLNKYIVGGYVCGQSILPKGCIENGILKYAIDFNIIFFSILIAVNIMIYKIIRNSQFLKLSLFLLTILIFDIFLIWGDLQQKRSFGLNVSVLFIGPIFYLFLFIKWISDLINKNDRF